MRLYEVVGKSWLLLQQSCTKSVEMHNISSGPEIYRNTDLYSTKHLELLGLVTVCFLKELMTASCSIHHLNRRVIV